MSSYLNVKIKKTLEDIVDNTYIHYPEQQLELFKRFFIKLVSKQLKSKHGHYVENTHTIEIFNLERTTDNIIKTCIHELAHHVDFCLHGKTGHQQEFYDEYRKLLYSAFNMRLVNPYSFTDDSADATKVKKIVEEWTPNYVEYKNDRLLVSVPNAFMQKESLKENKYHWDGLQDLWIKEISAEEREQEENYLNRLECQYSIAEANNIEISAMVYIVVKENTYELKDLLKQQGFFFEKKGKKGVWKKKVKMQEAGANIQELKKAEGLAEAQFLIEKK